MAGIEAVAQQAEPLGVISSLAVIKPYGNKGQHGKGLLDKLEGVAEKADLVIIPSQHGDIYYIKAGTLSHERYGVPLAE